MHIFLVLFSIFAIVIFIAIGAHFAQPIKTEVQAAEAAEQAAAVKIVSIVDRLKAFWAKITKVF